MRELQAGVERFKRDVYPHKRGLFEKLAGGQSPHSVMITCSDSRIQSSLITNTEPGEIFVIRNAGNMVPPAGGEATGEQGAVEFAVKALGVKYAIVCGHSGCGAMGGLLDRSKLTELPLVDAWLRYAEPVLERLEGDNPTVEDAVRANVLVQVENLRTLDCVKEAMEADQLTLLGWYYDIATGRIENYDWQRSQFVELV